MRTYATAQDVLHNVQDCHHLAGQVYCQLKLFIEDERAKMLLGHLCEHEHAMEKNLLNYERRASKAVLHTWIQYSPELSVKQFVEKCMSGSMESVQEISEVGHKVDDYLVSLFDEMATISSSDILKEVFYNLKTWQMSEKHQLTQARNSLLDF